MTARKRTLLLAVLITLGFFGWIAVSSDWREIWSLLKGASFSLILMSALLSLPVQWLRARRFKLMLNITDQRDWPMFRVAGLLVLFNTVVPFRLGELSFPFLVNKTFGLSKAYALGVLTLVRLFDLALVMLLLAVFGFFSLPDPALQTLAATMAAGAVAVMAVLLFAAKPICRWLLKYTGDGAIGILLRRAAEGASASGIEHRSVFVGYSLGIWLLLGGMSTLAATAVIPVLSIVDGYFAAAASNIAFALPVSGFASLGPAQVAWAEALRLNGYLYPLAIASALAVHVAVLLGIALTAIVITFRR